MQTKLLKNTDDWQHWLRYNTGSGIYWSEDTPVSYPCIIAYYEYDISNSMSYGSGIVSEFIYPDDFNG